jgi:hypothetical protein
MTPQRRSAPKESDSEEEDEIPKRNFIKLKGKKSLDDPDAIVM